MSLAVAKAWKPELKVSERRSPVIQCRQRVANGASCKKTVGNELRVGKVQRVVYA